MGPHQTVQHSPCHLDRRIVPSSTRGGERPKGWNLKLGGNIKLVDFLALEGDSSLLFLNTPPAPQFVSEPVEWSNKIRFAVAQHETYPVRDAFREQVAKARALVAEDEVALPPSQRWTDGDLGGADSSNPPSPG